MLLNGVQLKFPSLNSVAINASGEIHTYPTATRIINNGISTPSVLATTEQTHPVGCWTVCELHVSLFMTRLWKTLSLQSSWTAVCFSSLPSAPEASTNERNRNMLSVWSLNCRMEHYRLLISCQIISRICVKHTFSLKFTLSYGALQTSEFILLHVESSH